jgi:hypothetical protein
MAQRAYVRRPPYRLGRGYHQVRHRRYPISISEKAGTVNRSRDASGCVPAQAQFRLQGVGPKKFRGQFSRDWHFAPDRHGDIDVVIFVPSIPGPPFVF